MSLLLLLRTPQAGRGVGSGRVGLSSGDGRSNGGSGRRNDHVGRAAARAVETLESRVHLHAGHDHTADPLTTTSAPATQQIVQPLSAPSTNLAVTATTPLNGANNVAVGANVTVTFS